MLSNFCTEWTTDASHRKDLWHFSQPCCYVDLYVGLYISAMCVKAITLLYPYLPVYQATASLLQMRSVPDQRASQWRYGLAHCYSYACICFQTYWQTEKVNKEIWASFLTFFVLPCIHQPSLVIYEIWITYVYQRQGSMDLLTEF